MSLQRDSLLRDAEECVGEVIEDEMGLKAVLVAPGGIEYSKSALDPTEDLKAMLTRESLVYDANSGMEIMSEKPVASFRIRSLEKIPQEGEVWLVRLQESVFSDDMKSFTVSGPPEYYRTLGFININLQAVSQI